MPRDLLGVLCDKLGDTVDPAASQIFVSGRTAFLDALDEAERILSSRAAPQVILGGVDSLVDHDRFDALARAGRIKTSTQDGIVPGEGAAFVRLTLASGRGGHPEALACIAASGRAEEPHGRQDDEPNAGEGLSAAARAALEAAAVSSDEVAAFVHDAAGDRFGMREVGMALARLRPRADPPAAIWAPASALGDLGAAYGPFALALASFFLARKVDPDGATLVLASGEDKVRGAVVVQPAATAGR